MQPTLKCSASTISPLVILNCYTRPETHRSTTEKGVLLKNVRVTLSTNLVNYANELSVDETVSFGRLKVVSKSTIRHELGDDEHPSVRCITTEAQKAYNALMRQDVHHLCLLTEGFIICIGETLLHCHLHTAYETRVDHTKVASSQLLIQPHILVMNKAFLKTQWWWHSVWSRLN